MVDESSKIHKRSYHVRLTDNRKGVAVRRTAHKITQFDRETSRRAEARGSRDNIPEKVQIQEEVPKQRPLSEISEGSRDQKEKTVNKEYRDKGRNQRENFGRELLIEKLAL